MRKPAISDIPELMSKPKKPALAKEMDRYSETVARNLIQLIEAGPGTPNAMQEKVRAKLGNRTSALTDFIGSGKSRTVTVENLGVYAEVLEVPITAFFVPPGKRDDLMELLRILGIDEPLREQALDLVHEMSRAARTPLEPRAEEVLPDTAEGRPVGQ